MMDPSVGQLLRGLHKSLSETVLPDIPPGRASRQLRAALHLLGRLERSWDLPPAIVAADNEDVAGVLNDVFDALRTEGAMDAFEDLRERFANRGGDAVPEFGGINDPGLASAAAENRALHGLLEEIELRLGAADGLSPGTASAWLGQIAALQRRISDRMGTLVGDPDR